MPDFSTRSHQKEFLDEDNIPFADLEINLRELDFINTWLGGHAITTAGLSMLMKEKNRTYTLLDIGSGGGDTLRFIAKWAQKKNIRTKLIGLDYKQEAIDFSTLHSKAFPNISFVCADYRDIAKLGITPDIILSSLFCHHLNDEQLVDYLKIIHENATLGWIINDLHRHPFAHYSIKWLTQAFSSSYLVKNDAPLSVLRGFSKSEWEEYFKAAGIQDAHMAWKWAFRWLIICTC